MVCLVFQSMACKQFENTNSRATRQHIVFGLSITIIDNGQPAHAIVWRGRGLVFNPTFNNISIISLLSIVLVAETGVPGENHRRAANH